MHSLFRFLSKYRAVTLIAAALLWGALGVLASRVYIQEDISKTFPQDSSLQQYQDFYKKSPLASKVVVAVSSDHGSAESISKGQEFISSIDSNARALIDTVEFEVGGYKVQSSLDYFYENLPYFLDKTELDSLLKSQDSAVVENNINRLLIKLSSPEGYALRNFLVRDPAGMYGEVMSKLSGFKEGGDFQLIDDHLFTEDGKYALILITPGFPASESGNNGLLVNHLKEAADKVEGAEILFFGGPVIAAANAEQIKKDTTLAGTAAVILILGLLFWYYRKWSIPIVFFLPPLFGMSLALALIYIIKGEISIVTLGAGSIVLGIALDYCFHTFTHIKHSQSVEGALKDIAWPLVLSCFTTVLAFLSLLFLKSEILGDFGLLASFSLIGTLFFVLVILPHLVDSFKLHRKLGGKDHWVDRKFAKTSIKPVWTILGIIAVTVFLGFYVDRVSFEDDLNKINYFPEELQKAEQAITTSESKEKTLYVVTEATSVQDAINQNYEVSAALDSFKRDGLANSVVTINHLFPTSHQAEERAKEWNDQSVLKAAVEDRYKKQGLNEGIKESGFGEFYSLLNKQFDTNYKVPETLLSDPLFSNFFLAGDGKVGVVNVINLNPENTAKVESYLKGTGGRVVDKSAMASSLIDVVQDNLNLLFIVTTSLVFITLLLNYGRIELALLTFLPMVLSWFWILGLCGLLGIKFNFVNVLITTFIFGLGDDFCIFVSDGLLSKFKNGVNKLQSYKSAIILSTATTIVGTGVLLFAKHPALSSIASLSVIGMLCISFISLTLQPILFNHIAQKRQDKGVPPLTLFTMLTSFFSFGYFVLGSILMTLLVPVFYLLPAPKKYKMKVYGFLISKFSGSVLYTAPHVKKVIMRNAERFDKPSIIIANHQSFIDILAVLMLKPGVVILTKEWVWKSPLFGWVVRFAGFPSATKELDENEDQIEKCLKRGQSVAIFPEGTRSVDGKMKRFHKGAFYLADKYQVDIIPVVLHGFSDTIRKGGFTLLGGQITMNVLPRISPSDEGFGTGYRERAKKIGQYMRDEYQKLVDKIEDVGYHHSGVMSNYIYKGPILEWYVRVKMWIEKDFRIFDENLPKQGKIVDLGCGYGYLSYMLSLTGKEREVIGMDYDEEKIEVAQNGYAKTDRINFEVGSLMDYNPEPADAYVIKDVLHYLPSQKQGEVIENCCKTLNDGGVILLRDGFVENEQHGNTELTEYFSTKLMGFNKTENELSFMRKSLVTEIAEKYGLTITEIEANQNTSNQTLILRKPAV